VASVSSVVKQNPVHPENPVNPVQINSLTDSLTNRYTAIDAAQHACDPAGNLTRDRQGRTIFELWYVILLFTI
jgi:hypothetical protein